MELVEEVQMNNSSSRRQRRGSLEFFGRGNTSPTQSRFNLDTEPHGSILPEPHRMDRIPAGWENYNEIPQHVVQDPRTMIAVCHLMLEQANSNLYENRFTNTGANYPATVNEAFRFVKSTLEELRRLNMPLRDASTQHSANVNRQLHAQAEELIPISASNGIVNYQLEQEIVELDINLIMTAAVCYDPTVFEVPLKFARAIRVLLPNRFYAPVLEQLISLLNQFDLHIAFSADLKDVLIQDLRQPMIRGSGSELILRLLQFAHYCEITNLSPTYIGDSFERFILTNKLQRMVIAAAQKHPLESEEYKKGYALYEQCGSEIVDPKNSNAHKFRLLSLSVCAQIILLFLHKSPQSFKKNTFEFSLIEKLAPLVEYDLGKFKHKSFVEKSEFQHFCYAFEKHFLRTSVKVVEVNHNNSYSPTRGM